MDSNYSLSDVAAVTRGNDGFGFGDGGFFWIFALLLLPMMWGGGFGGFGNRGCGGQPVTEAGLCNAMNFNNLENAVGRGFDQQAQFAFQNQRDLCTGFTSVTGTINQARFENQNCCCETQKLIQQGQYQDAMNTAAINANTTASIQKVLDKLCENETNALRARVQQLELQGAMCGVVRYPTQTTYATSCNPFFGVCNGSYGNCCGNHNI